MKKGTQPTTQQPQHNTSTSSAIPNHEKKVAKAAGNANGNSSNNNNNNSNIMNSPIPAPRAGGGNKRGEWTGTLYRTSNAEKDVSGNGGSGGIRITREEVQAAFDFFDVSGKKVLKPRDLKNRLSAFYPNMTNKEYKFLISEPNFTVDTLYNLLENNNITNFDPVREAFRVYDPEEKGYIDKEVLRGIMSKLGYGEITDEDMDVLIKTADVNKDGKISLEDFRNMLTVNIDTTKEGYLTTTNNNMTSSK